MRAANRTRSWLFVALLALCPCCASAPPDIRVEALGDVARHRSWDWLAAGRGHVEAPTPDPDSLRATVARELERSLSRQGFRHESSHPDLLVFFRLHVRPQLVEVARQRALRELSNMNEAGAYRIEATELEREYFERAELHILLIEAGERRLIWRGVLEGRYPEQFAPHAEEAVSRLVRQIPAPRRDPSEPRVIAQRHSPDADSRRSPARPGAQSLRSQK